MSFYGSGNQGSGPPAPGQRTSVAQHNLQSNQSGGVDVIPSQLFNFTQSQLQFQPGSQHLSFSDPNNPSIQMQNIQLSGGAQQLLLQQQQQNYPNLNVNFLTEQMGVGQILQPSGGNQAQSMSMQNLITPMSVALTGVNFAQATTIQAQSATSQGSQQAKQRVFTGTVTKTHDNFGFIDEEVFFQMSVVKGVVLPKPGDRVLVEADFNPAMPFKWNATRVQIVNIGGLNNSLPNMNLNPGGKPQSPQPHSHGNSSGSGMMSQHSNSSQANNLHNMNFNQQSHGGGQKNQSQSQNSQSGMSGSGGHGQGPPQSQGNNRYQPGSNPVSIVSNPHSAYGIRNNSRPGPEDNSRAHQQQGGPRPQQRVRPPPPPGSAPPPPMVSLTSMDPHNVQHMQLPLPLQLPLSVPLQLPPFLQQLDRDQDKHDRDRDMRERERDRERDRERIEREKEHDRRERERERSLEREKEREKEREREYERKREREREREKQKRIKEDSSKRESRKKERERDSKRDSPARAPRTRSPIPLVRESRKRSRSRSKDTNNKDKETRDQSKSRSTSPKRAPAVPRERPTPRYNCELPKASLDVMDISVMELKRRYRNLYVPSDFILAKCSWQDTFPLQNPLDIGHSCPLHIFRRHSEKIELAEVSLTPKSGDCDTVVPPSLSSADESETLKVKVVLLSLPNKATLYRKACGLAEDSAEPNPQHPSRLINFVVGTKMGKNETMIIGGSWSPSLDGPNPESDPQVLINTAVRTTKALTGVDLGRCTKWYRFMELYYRRGSGNIETVVVLLPNVWTAVPSRKEWEDIQRAYKDVFKDKETKAQPEEKKAAENGLSTTSDNNNGQTKEPPGKDVNDGGTSAAAPVPAVVNGGNASGGAVASEQGSKAEEDVPKVPLKSEVPPSEDVDMEEEVKEDQEVEKNGDDDDIYGDLPPAPEVVADELMPDLTMETTLLANFAGNSVVEAEAPTLITNAESLNQSELASAVEVKVEVEAPLENAVRESGEQDSFEAGEGEDSLMLQDQELEDPKGTHFTQLDPKHMTVQKLREELRLRATSSKGLKKNQLVNLLTNLLKTEESTASKRDELGQLSSATATDGAKDELLKSEEMEIDSSATHASVNGLGSADLGDQVRKEEGVVAPAKEVKIEVDSSASENTTNADCESSKAQSEAIPTENPVKSESVAAEEGIIKSASGEKTDVEVDQAQGGQSRSKRSGMTYQVPVLPAGTNEKTRKVWERRFNLPKTAHILIHPSQEAKSGSFDCNQHSLSTLRDYRLSDNKEQSFEVSLCSEFFNEMLQRDFAFRIYRELVYQSNLEEKEDKATAAVPATKDECPTKKRKMSSSSSVTGTPKSKTVDPHLLLAFTFFDQTRCGYITDTDLEDLCLSLSLGLSKSHIRKLVQKVCTKGTLQYRKWTDVSVEDGVVTPDPAAREDGTELSLTLLSQGNKNLLPVFGKPKQSLELQDLSAVEDGESLAREAQLLLASCESDAGSVDTKRLKEHLEKSEKDRATLGSNMNLMKSSLYDAQAQVMEFTKANEILKEELARTKDTVKKLESSESSATNDLDILKKASERFIDRVKDLVKLPAPSNREKDVKVKGKDALKKEKSEPDVDLGSVLES